MVIAIVWLALISLDGLGGRSDGSEKANTFSRSGRAPGSLALFSLLPCLGFGRLP